MELRLYIRGRTEDNQELLARAEEIKKSLGPDTTLEIVEVTDPLSTVPVPALERIAPAPRRSIVSDLKDLQRVISYFKRER